MQRKVILLVDNFHKHLLHHVENNIPLFKQSMRAICNSQKDSRATEQVNT